MPYVADPAHMRVKPAELLDPAYLASRASLIDRQRAQRYPAGNPIRGGTVYLCAADAQGNMVSLIQSNYKGFGVGRGRRGHRHLAAEPRLGLLARSGPGPPTQAAPASGRSTPSSRHS
jgi:hypothetical protein